MSPGTWSMAARFHISARTAKTVLTIRPEGIENYLFLQVVDGTICFKDDLNTQEVTLALPQDIDQPVLLVAGMSDNRLWLRVQDGAVQTARRAARIDLARTATLFIGCRTNRARLLKTAGDFTLTDVVFWPDKNVLSPDHAATLEALDQPALWEAAR